jgi:hypothetical protein
MTREANALGRQLDVVQPSEVRGSGYARHWNGEPSAEPRCCPGAAPIVPLTSPSGASGVPLAADAKPANAEPSWLPWVMSQATSCG